MTAIHVKRLRKLAAHLRSGKLGHKKFNFAILSDSDGPKCGTAGCALGECPIVFPRQWVFNDFGEPLLRNDGASWTFSDAEVFFGITGNESSHLFSPYGQRPDLYGGRKLGDRAKPEQVADNIDAFLAHKRETAGAQ